MSLFLMIEANFLLILQYEMHHLKERKNINRSLEVSDYISLLFYFQFIIYLCDYYY
jgi:hypothetical protein